MANKNIEYEIFVQGIYQQLLVTHGLETIKVEHDIDLAGISGQNHQIDVYWEYKIGGVVHRVAIECKNYTSTITVGKVRDFQGVLLDVPNLQGVMVTRVGYQAGAVTYAKAYGIGLKIIREVQEKDWKGRIKSVHTEMRAISAKIKKIELKIDKEWVEKEMPGASIEFINSFLNASHDNALLFDNMPTGQTLKDKIEDCANALGVMSIDDDEIHQQSFDLKGYTFEIEGKPALKLAAITFDFQQQVSVFAEILSESAAEHILRDAISGNLQFIDKDGTVSGDTDD